MGGADDAHIDRQLGNSPQGANGTFLDHTQKLALHGQGQVADLIQKQRPALRSLEETFAVFVRAREGPFSVAEELGLQQSLGNGAAIDGHERALGPWRTVVDGSGNQLLAGARLAVHQHRRHAAGNLLDQAPHLLHHMGITQHTLQCRAARQRAALADRGPRRDRRRATAGRRTAQC